MACDQSSSFFQFWLLYQIIFELISHELNMLQAKRPDNGLVIGATVNFDYSVEKPSSSNERMRAKELALSKEIIPAVCALLNSNGGKVVLRNMPFTQRMSVIRKLEQSMISIIGIQLTTSNINFKEDKESIVVSVEKADYLITTNYYLYLPSQTQVVQVSPMEPLEKIKNDIIKRKVVQHKVELGSHCKIFLKNEVCGFLECKSVELQFLKSDRSKRTKLADRMTGKGNKFSCYVSAFSNHQGGHIYYGITVDGIVEGELVSSEDDKIEITKKVEKTINKMIWPEQIGQPKREVQWDIFFESVVGENNNAIPSTFVIVIYIAPCLGGVFTEEPECYEMVEGSVHKMSFATWKRRILQPIELFHSRSIPSFPQRITWGSTRIQRICTRADQQLTQCMNNGIPIAAMSTKLEEKFFGLTEVKLVILSKKVMVCYRSCCFRKAKELLEKYDGFLTKSTESHIFYAHRAYIDVALHRARRDMGALKKILVDALVKADNIVPSVITAAIYLLVATVVSLSENKEEDLGYSADALSTLALQHLQYVQDSPSVRADMEQKSHITLALFHLGCDVSGVLVKPQVDSKSLERAKSSVIAVNKSIYEGNLMNRYRKLQFNLVQSVLYYRYSQIHSDRAESFLQEAFKFSHKAECLASMYRFEEMLKWARACMALCTEGLLRTHFKDYTIKKSQNKQDEISTESEPVANASSSCDDDSSFAQVATIKLMNKQNIATHAFH